MASMSESLVSLRHVFKEFEHGEQRTLALDDIELTLRPNELLSIVGPSGCGKSTLLRIIAGFERPTRGECRFREELVTGPGASRSYIAQRPTLFPWLTARANIEFGLAMQHRPIEKRHDASRRLLEVVRLSKFADHYPQELSGGMQQRIAIARGLAINPDVILMDEPFGALDVQTRQIMQDELLRIWDELEGAQAIVFVTHSIREAILLGDRVAVMTAHPGRIREIYPVAVPRPRDPYHHDIVALEQHIFNDLREEFLRAAAQA
jgi:NitT/TauT family transport system ATP-binding protein